MISCGRCGKNNSNDVHFCQGCGTRLTAERSPDRAEGAGVEELRAVVSRLVADRLAQPEHATKAPLFVDLGQSKAHFRLTLVRRDGSEGQSYALSGEQIDIGRTEGTLTFDDPHLAPRHARIVSTAQGCVIRDLETRNGVYCRLRSPADLDDGDQILVGKQVLQFEVVPEFERALNPAVQEGVVLFGTPGLPAWGRLRQVTPTGVACDVVHLSRKEVVLGRDQADIVFSDDEFMSRRHAQLSLRQGRGRLEDLGSSNGTFVRLRGPRLLANGDLIRLGDELLRFELG